MHSAAFKAAGLEAWRYELWDVAAAELPGLIGRLRGAGYAGANVTIPHKLAVIGLLDGLDAVGTRVGAVNLVRKEGDRLIGSNVDVEGVAAALAEVGFEGGRAVVLGNGGAARAAAVALEGSEVTLVARSLGNWEDRGRLARSVDLLLNATPLGRQGEVPIQPDDLPRAAVVDLVYAKGGTPLVRSARSAGLAAADGWSVLLAQGAASFTAWTRLPAPLGAMRASLPG